MLLSILSCASINAASLCENLDLGKSCDQSKTKSLIDSEAKFKKYFNVVQGDHVGPHETEKYKSSQVKYQNSTVIINTKPLEQKMSCLANGGFDAHGNLFYGECQYASGAIYSKGLFNVNKIKENNTENTIYRGAVEIEATIAKNGKTTLQGGLWPAIWMMPESLDDTFMHDGKTWGQKKLWPSSMELDILEYMQGSSDVVGTLHYGLYTGVDSPKTSWNYTNNKDIVQRGEWAYDTGPDVYLPNSDPQTKHKFGFMWDVQQATATVGKTVILTWFYDGKPFYKYEMIHNNDETYTKTKYLKNALNTAWKSVTDDKCIAASAYTNKCPSLYLPNSKSPDKLAEAMFRSFDEGFDSGYYMILNLAVGGDGVVKDNKPVAKDINDSMTVYSIKRFVING